MDENLLDLHLKKLWGNVAQAENCAGFCVICACFSDFVEKGRSLLVPSGNGQHVSAGASTVRRGGNFACRAIKKHLVRCNRRVAFANMLINEEKQVEVNRTTQRKRSAACRSMSRAGDAVCLETLDTRTACRNSRSRLVLNQQFK